MAEHRSGVGQERGQQEQREVQPDHPAGHGADLVEERVVQTPDDPDEVEGQSIGVERAPLLRQEMPEPVEGPRAGSLVFPRTRSCSVPSVGMGLSRQ
jgi:hypothetical protein